MIWLKIFNEEKQLMLHNSLMLLRYMAITKSSNYEEELVVMEMSVTKFTLLVVSYLRLPLKDDCIFIFQTLKV